MTSAPAMLSTCEWKNHQRIVWLAVALALLPSSSSAALISTPRERPGPSQQLIHASDHRQIPLSVPSIQPEPGPSTFSLVHAVHIGGYAYPGLHVERAFDPKAYPLSVQEASEYTIQDLPVLRIRDKIWRPSHPARSAVYEASRRRHKNDVYLNSLADQLSWEEIDYDVPDVSDVETLATLAKMASNAYSTPKDSGWYDLSNTTLQGGSSWNATSSFGWDEDGVRGHVFSSGPNNDSIIIAIKGTSAFFSGPVGRNDKLNDNLLFSCCCARVDATWSTVCDCYSSPNQCNQTCVEDALIEKSVYYPAATDLYNNITRLYPTSNIWLTGHSLGGSLAGLLATTFGVPCVTFEAPGELMAAKRLHLPLPPGSNWEDKRPEFGVTHVYTNSDPIPQGTCTGPLSSCAIFGFAMESKCHTGQSIVYDAVGKLGWSVDIRTHRIGTIIDKLLIPDWDKDEKGIDGKKAPAKPRLFSTPLSNSRSWGLWPWPRKGKDKDDKDKDPGDSEPGDPGDTPDDPKEPDIPDQPQPQPTQTPPVRRSHVPVAQVETNCTDCFKWNYFDPDASTNGTSPAGILRRRAGMCG